jgi:hypothetical protein
VYAVKCSRYYDTCVIVDGGWCVVMDVLILNFLLF